MRRISSLPTAEFCPKVDKIGLDVETTQSFRSTVFHAYCDTGEWPEGLATLPEADREEIGKWKVPMPFNYKVGDVSYLLQYKNAVRETRVALDKRFNYVDVPSDVPQNEIAQRYPEVMIAGHLDMAWPIKEHDLVIVCDIKSSIWAVKERTASLQLHGYGMAMCAKLGIGRYVTGIWDASDGRYYVSGEAVEIDGFEASSIRDRIAVASSEREGDFRTGTHCSGCWKRSHCPAHLVDVPEGAFKALFSGTATEKDIREALVRIKQMDDLKKKADEACRDWVKQHGPVRSEDGKKWWRCELREGRDSLDEKAICRALGVENLDDYKKQGKDFSQFNWRNVEG